jgi:O-acetyl-ADP-ribose deacetylase (regulator of RNase III)
MSSDIIMLDFTGDEQKEVPLLASTVRSVLTMAAAHGMQSVAMPLIGHGLAGWPANLAAGVHVEQALRFFRAAQAGPFLLQVDQAG